MYFKRRRSFILGWEDVNIGEEKQKIFGENHI